MTPRQSLYGRFLSALLWAQGLTVGGCAEGGAGPRAGSPSPDDANTLSHQAGGPPDTQVAASAMWSATSMPNVAITSGESGPVVFPPLSGTGGLLASDVDICAEQAPSTPFFKIFINLTPNVPGAPLTDSSSPLQNPPLGAYTLQPAATAHGQPAHTPVADGYVDVAEAYLDAASGKYDVRRLSSFDIEGGRLTLSAIDINARTVQAVIEGLVTSGDRQGTGGPSSYTGPSSITLAGTAACRGFVLSHSGVGTLPFF